MEGAIVPSVTEAICDCLLIAFLFSRRKTGGPLMICSWIDWIFPVLSSWLMGTTSLSGPPPWSRLRYNYKGNFSIMPLAVVKVNYCSSVTDVSTLCQALWISLGKRMGQLLGGTHLHLCVLIYSLRTAQEPLGFGAGPDRWQPVRCLQAGAWGKRKADQVAPISSRSSPPSAQSRTRLLFHHSVSSYKINFQILSYHFDSICFFFIDQDKLFRHGVRWLMNLLSLSLSSLFSRSSRLFGV